MNLQNDIFSDLECFKNKPVDANDTYLIDLKFNWCLDCVYEHFGVELGVEKVIKDRFDNKDYLKRYSVLL